MRDHRQQAPSGPPQHPAKETAVFRQLAFPVCVFDRIKDVQREHEARDGTRLTLNETVSRIVREHQEAADHAAPKNVAREGRDHDQQDNRTSRAPR